MVDSILETGGVKKAEVRSLSGGPPGTITLVRRGDRVVLQYDVEVEVWGIRGHYRNPIKKRVESSMEHLL